MPTQVPYGLRSSLTLDVPAEAVIGASEAKFGERARDVGAAAADALTKPIHFPPLTGAVVPGDHVTVAVDPEVPQADAIVVAVVEALRSAGVAARDITLLYATDPAHAVNEHRDAMTSRLPADSRDEIRIVYHDPAKREDLSYLAATERGRAVYLHRAICDADFVVPIACAHSGAAMGCHAPGSSIYPLFSDEATRRRYRSPRLLDADPNIDDQARSEIEEVTWLLGSQFGIQVVPGPGETVLAVLTGEINAVFDRAREQHETAWHKELAVRPSLVVATIPGDATAQTWDNVGRALAVAANIVAENGAIAICCELAAEPGPAMQALAGRDDRPRVIHEIRNARPLDSSAALMLIRALERARVYLLSQLDEGIVEALDIAAVDNPEDIERLVKRHPDCIVLAGAQHATAYAAEHGALR
ncbi:MAG: DUF2088 domain-containing protein [Pirellulales bacterium]|nr:DUF2088 domain-containing protein [Pirellulales bacterium]